MTPGVFLSFFPLSYAALSDFQRRIIPDRTVFLIFSCALLNVALGQVTLFSCVLGAAAIGGAILLAAGANMGIGGGDVKLCAALGALLGVEKMLIVLIAALLSLIVSGKLQKKTSLPFAPYVWGVFYILLVAEILQRR